MPKQYRAEIFARDFAFRGWSQVESPKIVYDYLTLEATEINLPKHLECQRGDYLCMEGYEGIVKSIEYDKNRTKLTVKPLLSLLDIQVYYDRNAIYTQPLETFIAALIQKELIDTDDEIQRVEGLRIETRTNQIEGRLNLKDNIHKLFDDIILKALTKYGITVKMSLDIHKKEIKCSIGLTKAAQKTIEADLPVVLEQSITLRDDYGAANKFIAVNKRNESETLTYYAEDYAPPCVQVVEYIDDDDFSAKAKERSNEALAKAEFENCIEIVLQEENTFLGGAEVGDRVNVIKDGVVYPTVLTGYEIERGRMRYIFGAVRLELTKILIMERRAEK